MILTKICTKCSIKKSITDFPKNNQSKDGLNSYCKKCKNNMNKIRRESNKEYYLKQEKKFRENNMQKIKEYKKNWDLNNKDKLEDYCMQYRDMKLLKMREYYCKNYEKLKKSQKRYYYKNKEILLAKMKTYREDNKEKLKESRIEYYYTNREHILKLNRKNRKNNIKYFRERERKYRKTNKYKTYVHNIKIHRRHLIISGNINNQDLLELINKSKKCYWCNKMLNGKYHIDHYIPLSKGGLHKLDNLVISCAFCNLSKNNKDPLEFAHKIGRLL
jgi:5-methylcytosine-specific restriction endonuclease McrA